MTVKKAFLLFDLNPVQYFRSCNSQVEANNTLNFVKEIVKKAYKKLALKYHPDSNSGKGNPKLFAKFTEAKNVLLNLKIKPTIKDLIPDIEIVFEGVDFSNTPDETVKSYWSRFGGGMSDSMKDVTSSEPKSGSFTWTRADY